ncbi:hypothetical protein GCM10028793_35010 [Nocardiopsis oceani]
MDPADGHVQVLGSRYHAGPGLLEGGELEDLGKGGKHTDSLGRSVRKAGVPLYRVQDGSVR